jgi:hypothetical protein
MNNSSSKIAVGFTYDSTMPLQLSIYVSAKDRSDSLKLKYVSQLAS